MPIFSVPIPFALRVQIKSAGAGDKLTDMWLAALQGRQRRASPAEFRRCDLGSGRSEGHCNVSAISLRQKAWNACSREQPTNCNGPQNEAGATVPRRPSAGSRAELARMSRRLTAAAKFGSTSRSLTRATEGVAQGY